jgi:DNA-directed RNA polymerase subunit RPC12/RpoP
MAEEFFCVKCKKKVKVENFEKKEVAAKGGKKRTALTATCPTCGTKMFKFVKG